MMSAQLVQFPASIFVPLGLAFFGLGTGYLIFGPQELLNFPARDANVDLANGAWGFWMPGFCQFVNGMLLLIGLSWFPVFKGSPLYAAGIITSVFGIHWFAMGYIRMRGGDPRPGGFMAIAFFLVSLLGFIVFLRAGDWPVWLLFIGLMAIYVADFFVSFGWGLPGSLRAMGFLHTLTGLWLMYLTFAIVLNLASGTHLPL